jgi:hypothetical protein
VNILLAIYVTGVAIGLLVMRDPWPVRIGAALVWPAGILSFVVVTVILVLAACYLWPVLLLGLIAIAAALWLAFWT